MNRINLFFSFPSSIIRIIYFQDGRQFLTIVFLRRWLRESGDIVMEWRRINPRTDELRARPCALLADEIGFSGRTRAGNRGNKNICHFNRSAIVFHRYELRYDFLSELLRFQKSGSSLFLFFFSTSSFVTNLSSRIFPPENSYCSSNPCAFFFFSPN